MSAITQPAPTAAFAVEVREGCYAPATPRDKFVKVTVTVPGLTVELLFPADMPHVLFSEGAQSYRPWSELAREAIRLRNASSGAERADVAELARWLADPANVDALDRVWAAYRLRHLQKRLRKTRVLMAEHCRRWGLEVPAEDVEALADSVGVLGDISDVAGGTR
jgi:hypothetical protein